MKRVLILSFTALFLTLSLGSCKALAKKAAKRWARKKRKEWVQKCEDSAVGRFGDRGSDFCDCALEVAMEKYPNAEDGMALKFMEMLTMAKDCITQ